MKIFSPPTFYTTFEASAFYTESFKYAVSGWEVFCGFLQIKQLLSSYL